MVTDVFVVFQMVLLYIPVWECSCGMFSSDISNHSAKHNPKFQYELRFSYGNETPGGLVQLADGYWCKTARVRALGHRLYVRPPFPGRPRNTVWFRHSSCAAS